MISYNFLSNLTIYFNIWIWLQPLLYIYIFYVWGIDPLLCSPRFTFSIKGLSVECFLALINGKSVSYVEQIVKPALFMWFWAMNMKKSHMSRNFFFYKYILEMFNSVFFFLQRVKGFTHCSLFLCANTLHIFFCLFVFVILPHTK